MTGCFGRTKHEVDTEPYRIQVNSAEGQEKGRYPTNYIRTSKYSIFTFLPLNLFEQLRRFSNMYFLLTAIISLIPSLSPLSPVTTIAPLVFVLFVTALKDGYEDVVRHRADKAANSAKYEVLRMSTAADRTTGMVKIEVESADIRVGDIVIVNKESFFPADLVALCTSETEGVCYVETSNLDGETNLKRRQVPLALADLREEAGVMALRGVVVCEPPTTQLYKFQGNLTLGSDAPMPLTQNNLLLRGSKLRNTKRVYGIVVYAGVDSKLFKNLRKVKPKFSQAQRLLNQTVAAIFVFNMALLFTAGVLAGVFQRDKASRAAYLDVFSRKVPAVTGVLNAITYFVLFTYLIPISLFVTVELVRVGQKLFMEWDKVMAKDSADVAGTAMMCRNSNMNEELGLVDHIFSDKTGTLTMNVMELAEWSVNGRLYDQRADPKCLLKARKEAAVGGGTRGRSATSTDGSEQAESADSDSGNASTSSDSGSDSSPFDSPQRTGPTSTVANSNDVTMVRVVRSGEANSSVETVPERGSEPASATQTPRGAGATASGKSTARATPRSSSTTTTSISAAGVGGGAGKGREAVADAIDDAASADDAAADSAAPALLDPVTDYLRVIALCHTVVPEAVTKDGKTVIKYEAESPDEVALIESAAKNGVVLKSIRGRTTIIEVDGREESYEALAVLEFNSDRKRMSVILRFPDGSIRLVIKGADNMIMERLRKSDPLLPATTKHLEKAAREGLRTLLVAQRVLPPAFVKSWLAKYAAAQTDEKNRALLVDVACEEIEVELTLLGATAVEDKLQRNVPETLSYLLAAGISVWVLTGDKRETAENIGYSSSLLAPQVDLIRLSAESVPEFVDLVQHHLTRLGADSTPAEHAMIIDGATLVHALDGDGATAFLALGAKCQAVICCRVTPLQKALVVGLAKDRLNRITLAVGDGANDVSMLLTAHIGVGIVGNEGTQAVRAADFALHEFRLLAPLICVQGRYSLVRIGKLVLYSFAKNIAFILPQFLYGFYSGWSGTVVYDEIVLTTFNIFWAALPPLYIGMFERDLSKATILRHPSAFAAFKRQHIFDLTAVAIWMASAVYIGIVLYFMVFHGVMGLSLLYPNGQTADRWVVATIASTIGVFIVLLKAALVIEYWNIFAHISIWGSMAVYFLFVLFYMEVPFGSFNSSVLYTFLMMLRTPAFWFAMPIVTICCVLPEIVIRFVLDQWWPSQTRILKEMEKYGIPDETEEVSVPMEIRSLRVTPRD